MSKAPKKIWFDLDDCSAGPVQFADDEIPYIREDVVLELVEALKLFIEKHPSMFGYPGEPQVKIKRALAKLEESHD